MGVLGRPTPPLSEDEFGQTIAERIKRAGESGKVVYDSDDFCILVEDDDGELVGQFRLDNVYQEYCSQPAVHREAALAKVVKVALVRHKTLPEEFADAKPDILPAVRSRYTYEMMWLEQRAQGKPVGPDLPFFCVGDDLIAMPVYDLPEATHTISRDQLKQWGVSFYETMEGAKHNLAEIEFSVAKSGVHLYGVMTGDSYDSSRLLLDFVRQLEVEGDTIAMVPHRDLLLITGSEDVGGLDVMATLAREAFDHPRYLTCTALCLDGDNWVSWMPPKDHLHFAKFRFLEVKSFCDKYERQKELLDTLHRREDSDLFAATYTVAQDPTGTCVSYAVWSEGTDTLLPKANKVFFVREGQGIVASGDWEKVEQIVGHLMQPTDMYPLRFRVREFPTDEQLAAIGNELN